MAIFAKKFDLKLDQDIMDLISLHSDSEGADKALKYLTECLSCNFRVAFDFQIQKMNLLKSQIKG